MAVPDHQSFMLPILQIAGDGLEHGISEVKEIIASSFGLTDADRNELLPSGTQFRFENRVHWARSKIKHAGLLENTSRGKFRITERGLQVLQENPPYINQKFLLQFPEFQEFRSRNRNDSIEEIEEEQPSHTPQEILDAGYQSLRNELAQEVLDRVMNCTPRFFEQLVVDLLVAMGYGGSRKDAGEATRQSGDGGVDGIIKEDRLGLDAIYLQAKRWEGTVGRPVVQAFAGSLEGARARKGVLITTSNFSKDAIDYVDRIEKKIVLIDGKQLAQYMIDYGIGVAIVNSYTVKKIDLDYFDEDQ
jgi:restriction system protein